MFQNWKKILLMTGAVILGAYIILVIARVPHAIEQQKTDAAVAKIHATKLTLDDVMGKNLPPNPGADADKTVQGVDANKNGIRDDVELAIFKTYPNSAKTRAALLQYALVLQMQMTLPIINMKTVTATVEDKSRAELCFWNLSSRSDMRKFLADIDQYRSFVSERQINTEQRKKYRNSFYENLGSYSASHESCDIDFSSLPN